MSATDKSVDRRAPGARKPYAKPRLVSYGHVKDIVQGTGGVMGDGATNMSRI